MKTNIDTMYIEPADELGEQLLKGSIDRLQGTRAAHFTKDVGALGVQTTHNVIDLPTLTDEQRVHDTLDVGIVASSSVVVLELKTDESNPFLSEKVA